MFVHFFVHPLVTNEQGQNTSCHDNKVIYRCEKCSNPKSVYVPNTFTSIRGFEEHLELHPELSLELKESLLSKLLLNSSKISLKQFEFSHKSIENSRTDIFISDVNDLEIGSYFTIENSNNETLPEPSNQGEIANFHDTLKITNIRSIQTNDFSEIEESFNPFEKEHENDLEEQNEKLIQTFSDKQSKDIELLIDHDYAIMADYIVPHPDEPSKYKFTIGEKIL